MVKTRNFVEGDSTLATKVVWDDELTLIFCELCVNEVNAGNRPTTHLNSKGWENVVALFQAKTQKIYRKPQLKNKWDTLKKEWRLWRELLKESTATGENAWAPSSGVLPSGVPMGDDAPNEGFGDSDKHSNENEGIPPDEIEKLCESMASPRKSVNEIIFPHSQYTISNAMDALRALGDEIPKKDELYYFATKMFQIPVKREVFLNLDPDDRVWWLRCEYAEQNPIASFSSLVMDEFNNMYNSFDMNYDTPKLSEKAQRRIAIIVTQVEHNNYHEEEEYVLSSVLNGKVSAMEKLALSLYILGNRESNSNATERFQRSGETVSRIFIDILHIFGRMRINTIKPTEGQFEEVPNHIRHDTRYWPHFKDCIGAINGTHIKACISPSYQIPYTGRKGKYYLVDSGYPQMAGFLGPYRGNDIIYLIFV
ncbi:hypothetical protein GOBAR_DD35878 [Gossypium barbadense]|nr:hypothetical protein GOBAR_DD35878 [Gossypium barbadense]